jgi:hypothetical protein
MSERMSERMSEVARDGGVVRSTARYEFRLAEQLSPTAVAAFPELHVAETGQSTVLFGSVRDRAEFAAILARFDLLGLTVMDVHRLPD